MEKLRRILCAFVLAGSVFVGAAPALAQEDDAGNIGHQPLLLPVMAAQSAATTTIDAAEEDADMPLIFCAGGCQC